MDASGQLLPEAVDLGLDGEAVPNDNDIEQLFRERKTKHADDAIDYEDIDELADDELPEETEPTTKTADDDFFNELLGDDEQQQQQKADDSFNDIFGDGGDDDLQRDKQARFDDHNNLNALDTHHDMMFDDDGLGQLVGELFMDDGEVFDARPVKRGPQTEIAREEKRQKLALVVAKLEKYQVKRNLRYHFPTFSPNKPYNFHLFFLPKPQYYRYQTPAIATREQVKPLVPTKLQFEINVDQRKIFKSRKLRSPAPPNVTNITEADLQLIEDVQRKRQDKLQFIKSIDFLLGDWCENDRFGDYSKELILATTDWDDERIYEGAPAASSTTVDNNLMDIRLDQDAEMIDDESIFLGQIADKVVNLDMNDPNLIFIPTKDRPAAPKPPTLQQQLLALDQLLIQRFNFLNDKAYERLKENYITKVRSQLSNLNIEHLVPALRLQSPYYKVKLTKEEARNFHRNRLVIRPGTLVLFSKLRVRKKKKDKGKTFQEIFARTSDLTAADNCQLVAMEYLEEYPHILLNFGMGSKIINYYRKELPDDTLRPKLQIGETHVLGPEDRLPFWNFGEVGPGDFVPALYNNMVRAPIYRHTPRNTDFLFIRLSGNGLHQRYFLRTINYNYALGNSFPAVEIPAPHSRKVTNTLKNRLKMIVYRVMNKNGVARVLVKDVLKHFPDQNDMQNRQRLKEFMEYQRQGDDQRYWKVKGPNSDIIPPEDEIRAMILPEDCALLDAMQHGQQVLEDTYAIYGGDEHKKAEAKREREERKEKKRREEERANDPEGPEDMDDDDLLKKKRKPRDPDAEIDLDEELTPWSLTRNFVTANQLKLMLQLIGEGDPTGIGIGFSFMRATQRQPFHPLHPPPKELVPKNNTAAYQQKLYEAEIKRIWYTQRKLLVDHGDHNFNLSKEIYTDYPPVSHTKVVHQMTRDEKMMGKVLRITRRVRDENGIVQRKIETITDPRVIRAYIRRRKQIDYELLKNADLGEIRPGTNEEMNEIKKQALKEKIALLEKRAKMKKTGAANREAAAAAQSASGSTAPGLTPGLVPPLVASPSASGSNVASLPAPQAPPKSGKGIGKGKLKARRCTLCGEFGHIKTKKTCPNFFKNDPDANVPEVFGPGLSLVGGADDSLKAATEIKAAFALTNQVEDDYGTPADTPQ